MSRAQTHVAATAFLALFSIVGFALYGLPFFYDFFVRDLGWTRQEVTSGNAYSKLLVGPLFGFLAGWFVDRFGPRRLMLAGILMGGGALVGLGTVSTLSFFYLFYLFNALGYVCGGPLPNQVLLARWFDRNRGKAMGFAYLGIGVGGAIVPLLAHALTQRFGWQAALQILGVLMILIAFPMAWFVREQPDPSPGTTHEAPGTTHEAPGTRHEAPHDAPGTRHASLPSLRPVLTSPAFYLLLVGSMCSIGAVGGTMQNLKLFLSLDVKLAQGEVARIASLVLVGSLVGRISMGYLADRFPKKYVMLLIYSIVACAIPLLFLADAAWARYAFALLFGIGLGGDYMIIPLMAAELFGVKMLGRLMGIVLTADGIAEATAPMLVAGIRDTTGSYASGFAVLIGLAAVGAAAVALLPRRGPEALGPTPGARGPDA
jgi:sugar phosphate permease